MSSEVKKTTFENKILLNAVCMDKNEDGIWFIHNNYPILFCYDLEKKEVVFAKVIPANRDGMIASFSSIHIVDEKIYLIPNNAQHIFVYYKKVDAFEKLTIKNASTNMFRDSFLYGEYIYCIPYRYNDIVKLNYVTNEITYISIDKERHMPQEADFCINSVFRYKDVVLSVVWQTNLIISFDLKCEKVDFFTGVEDGEVHSLSRICVLSNHMYLYDDKRRMCYTVNLEGKKMIKTVSLDFEDALFVPNNETLIIDPNDQNGWQIVDPMLNEILYTYSDYEVGVCIPSIWKQGCYVNDKLSNLYRIGLYGELMGIRKDGSVFRREYISINKEKWIVLFEELTKNDTVLETNTYGMQDFINRIIGN